MAKCFEDKLNNIKNYLLTVLKDSLFSKKFNIDIVWSTGSFAIMAVVGLLINIIIAKKYGADTLGVFSQVYAIYLLLSQLSASGIHLSILKITAQYADEPATVKESFSSALLLVVFTAGLTISLIYVVKDSFDQILSSPGVSVGLALALPGLFLFSLNKTFLALLNGLRHMREYAVFQGLRSFLILTSLLLIISFHVEGQNIPVIFSMSEGVLLLLQLPLLMRWLDFRFSQSNIKWIKMHWSFGTKAMLGNLLLDVNSRVDVLFLGFFASDYLVGIYSFAAMLADGFAQLLVVLRTIINPVITQVFHEDGKLALQSIMRRGKKTVYLFFAPIGMIAILGYPALNLLGLDPAFNQSWLVFSILMVGVLLSAGYLPFQMIFNQTGHPWYQTVFLTLFFFTNVILNLIFIPIFGIYGSAIATALAFILQVFYLKKLLFLWIDIKF
jgi:O-antigen/teichoic acid export membrane protein